MRAGLRATLAIFVGLFALVTGLATSVVHVIGEGASGVDYTGVLAAAGGGVLMGAGAVTLWRSRKLDRKAWRYGRRALIGIAGSLVALQVVGGAALGYYATHRPESAVGEPSLGVAHEDVTLTTSDGLELEGWYVPSRNRAAVLVFPGRSGNKQHHARNLISPRLRRAPDRQSRARARAKATPTLSAGTTRPTSMPLSTSSRIRADVDANRIGGLGLSVGGETLLETAAHTDRLRAVVSEGAGGRIWREDHEMPHPIRWYGLPYFAMASATTSLFSNTLPPDSLKDLVKDIPPRPVFLIHAKGEDLTPVYFRSAGSPENWALWEVPGAKHVGGLEARPEEYERRVTAFFDRALLKAT